MVVQIPKYMYLIHCISLCVQIWLCQNLVKFNSQFVKLLMGPQRQTCLFQIKRILGFCCRYSAKILIWVTHKKGICFPGWLPFCLHRLLQCCRDDSLNVTVPMRMLEIFSAEKTYHPVIPDTSCVTSLLEQILHYMVQKGNINLQECVNMDGLTCTWLFLCIPVRCWAQYLYLTAAWFIHKAWLELFCWTLSVWKHFGMKERKAQLVDTVVLIPLFLFRILQIAVCPCESQASFQFGVQQLSLCPSSKHTVGAHP